MIILTLIAFVVFAAYIIGILRRYGVPNSISESYMLLPVKWRWLFTLFCFVISFLMTIVMADMSDTALLELIAGITGAGLLFVGAAAEYKQRMTRTVHYIGAISCIAGSQLWIALYTHCFAAIIFVFAFAILLGFFLFKKEDEIFEKWLFLLEMGAFLTLFLLIPVLLWS